jgi:hypothetical protein
MFSEDTSTGEADRYTRGRLSKHNPYIPALRATIQQSPHNRRSNRDGRTVSKVGTNVGWRDRRYVIRKSWIELWAPLLAIPPPFCAFSTRVAALEGVSANRVPNSFSASSRCQVDSASYWGNGAYATNPISLLPSRWRKSEEAVREVVSLWNKLLETTQDRARDIREKKGAGVRKRCHNSFRSCVLTLTRGRTVRRKPRSAERFPSDRNRLAKEPASQ